MSFGIQHHGTQTFRHTVGPISFCFFAQANQPLIGAGMQSQQAWQHTASRYQYAIYVPLVMRGCIAPQNEFELKLPQPSDWDMKFFFTACGGFCGFLDGRRCNLGLARGYATVTGSGGHESMMG